MLITSANIKMIKEQTVPMRKVQDFHKEQIMNNNGRQQKNGERKFVIRTFGTRMFVTILITEICDQKLKMCNICFGPLIH